eukprot:gnl/MRDRNA2_/MRDRNA2_71688_c0_seq1.p1 gnl/MRDRNA2_/MRDRNA2_71688_c0~~gnl/MRDRNA2_/MRDRNA2_71688_c0_seq1.p1  ORF type:complete len:388 (+),score=73.14 gnl/MRDRNA2_/MRDRNA2_71688_c0_seq1:27-1166(+)
MTGSIAHSHPNREAAPAMNGAATPFIIHGFVPAIDAHGEHPEGREAPATKAGNKHVRGRTTLPSLQKTLNKLNSDHQRVAHNMLKSVNSTATVARFAGRLVHGLKHLDTERKYIDSPPSPKDENAPAEPADSKNSKIWFNRMLPVWTFLARLKSLEMIQQGGNDETSKALKANPNDFQAMSCSESGLGERGSSWGHIGFSLSGHVTDHEKIPSGGMSHPWMFPHDSRGSKSCRGTEKGSPKESRKESPASGRKSKKEDEYMKISDPGEGRWNLIDDSDFADELLFTLFEAFALRKDYSNNKLMGEAEWNSFWVHFEEHFPGIAPSHEKLTNIYAGKISEQVEICQTQGMEKGEASRGLSFETFKGALHRAIGHHWHKAV